MNVNFEEYEKACRRYDEAVDKYLEDTAMINRQFIVFLALAILAGLVCFAVEML